MSLILCCLLLRNYDAWRIESCQKHFQKLLFDLIERWILWMWDEKIKNRKKISKFDIFIAIAIISSIKKDYSTSFAFNQFSFFFEQFIVFNTENKKKKKNSNSIFLSFNQLLIIKLKDCELYEIKFSILKATSNEILKSCFFWIIHENDFQIFNANWLKIEKNNCCENHDYNDFFKSKNFDAKITITMIL